jgi:hypothetical protein
LTDLSPTIGEKGTFSSPFHPLCIRQTIDTITSGDLPTTSLTCDVTRRPTTACDGN